MLSSAHRSNGEVNPWNLNLKLTGLLNLKPPLSPPRDSDVGYPWYVTPSLLASARRHCAITGTQAGRVPAARGRPWPSTQPL
jgi:hypothetical protein